MSLSFNENLTTPDGPREYILREDAKNTVGVAEHIKIETAGGMRPSQAVDIAL